jgi:asparagine synthase (glutamine-hydrolysing)
MCGISGIFYSSGTHNYYPELIKSLDAIKSRGPDGITTLLGPGFALGHARLAIIDIETGQQPQTSHDGRYTIVFNGEIYNYLELRKILQDEGHKFKTQSDTEVIMESFRKWGPKCSTYFNGMWAFAIHDVKNQNVFCSRDPFGQKPFFYTKTKTSFAFASELSALKSYFRETPKLNSSAINHYLFFEAFYGSMTIFEDLAQLEPSHNLFLDLATLKLQKDKYETTTIEPETHKDFNSKSLDFQIRRAVELAFRADVPVASLLSGGLDSSLVLAILKSLYPDAKLQAFHLQSGEGMLNETNFASEVAKILNIPLEIHSLNHFRLKELARLVPSLLDQPQADPGILCKFEITKILGKSFKVAMTGDGGDEFFLGYLIFKAEQIVKRLKWVPNFFIINGLKSVIRLAPTHFGYMSIDFMAKNFLKGYSAPDWQRSLIWMQSFGHEALAALSPELARKKDLIKQSEVFFEQLYSENSEKDLLDKLAFRLQKSYLPNYILPNSDRASMLNGVELRSPLLDTNLTRFLNQAPAEKKMPNFKLKAAMKELAEEKYLPSGIVNRKKVGFTAPMAELFRNDFNEEFDECLNKNAIEKTALFNFEYISKIRERHQSGQENLYKPLWTLYSLQRWLLTH